MGGIWKIFTRLVPFIMILCLVTFGINVMFNQNGLTYLNVTEINGERFYEFDFVNYVKGINMEIIKSAISNVIDIDGLMNVINDFKNIWQDGYQILDISKTILNFLILIIDIILTGLNIVIVPLRLIAGLLLTAFQIVGINTNADSFLNNVLRKIVNLYRIENGVYKPLIPLIDPITKVNSNSDAGGTSIGSIFHPTGPVIIPWR